jgi:type I restriction enzyme R subunit
MAKEMADAEQQGNDLGLTNEEKAFYDALTRPQAVKDFYTNDQLVSLTKELTDMLRRNRTIDWNRREAERANMRRLVKRLLKKYKYPPEEAEDAMNVVLKQCEQWADTESTDSVYSIKKPKPYSIAEDEPLGMVADPPEGFN